MKKESGPMTKRIRIESVRTLGDENVHSLGEENDLLIAKICDLQTEVLAQRAEIRQLTKAVATLTDIVKKTIRTMKPELAVNADDDFPIKTEEELVEVDEKISQDSTIYVTSIKKLLSRGRASRTIRLIFGDEIILAYNIDGAKNKKRLKDHTYLFRALMDAIGQIETKEPSERVLSKAMRCVKNYACKNKSRVGEEDPLSFLDVELDK
nr:uncharacterized protein LOC108067453 [Drosophila takahashii]